MRGGLSAQIARFAETRDDIEDNFYLQALSDMHLYSDFDIDVYGSTEPRYPYVRIFIIVALAIVLIACINFMNLSTAQSERRAKEIGLRKTVGSRPRADRRAIAKRVGAALAAGAVNCRSGGVVLMLPAFNHIVDKSIRLDSETWSIWNSLCRGGSISWPTGGKLPSPCFCQGSKPVQVLKGGFTAQRGGTVFRRVLVVTQFAVTIILILGTTVVYRQFQYVMEKDLGYDKDLLVYMPVLGGIMDSYDGFRNDLTQQPSVKGVTTSSDIPIYTVSASLR